MLKMIYLRLLQLLSLNRMVTMSKYNYAVNKHNEVVSKCNNLIDERDTLHTKLQYITSRLHQTEARYGAALQQLHAARGMNHSMYTQAPEFSQDEIRKMLSLCHPDKHGGKAMATEITQKLNKMRQ